MGKVCSSSVKRDPESPDNGGGGISDEKIDWLLQCMDQAQIMNFFTDQQKRNLVKSMQLFSIEPGETIITQHDTENSHLYVLETGEVDVYIFDKLVRTLRSGDNFGELAFAFGCVRSATCKMKERGVLWVLDHETFQKSLAESLKSEGMFKIQRQLADNGPNPDDNDDDHDSDMEVIHQAGLAESFFSDEASIPRVLPHSFIRRVSEQRYEAYPSLVERNMALWDRTHDDQEWFQVDPYAQIVE